MSSILEMNGYLFNWHAIPPLIVGILLAVLGLVVLIRERATFASTSFALLTISGTFWLMGYAAIFSATTPALAIEWIKIQHIGVVFIPTFLFLFTLVSIQHFNRLQRYFWISFAFSVFFLAAVFPEDGFIAGVYDYSWGYFTRYGPLGIVFLVFFMSVMVASIRLYLIEYKKFKMPIQSKKLRHLLIAFSVVQLGAVDYFPAFGIPIYPFGYIPVLIFIGLLAQILWRYRLADITPAFAAREIISTMDDALIVVDCEGAVRIVNEAACALLNKSRSQMIGLPVWAVNDAFLSREQFQILIRGEVDHGNYGAHLPQVEDRERLLSVTVSLIREREKKEPSGIVCIARDISEQQEIEELLSRKNTYVLLLQQIAICANQAKTIEELLVYSLEKICIYTGWIAGHAYLGLNNAPEVLVSSPIWYLENRETFKSLRELTEKVQFKKGMGIVGHVLESGKPVWVSDVTHEKDFIRIWPGFESPLRAYLAVPVLVRNETVAVLEFFSDQKREPDKALLQVLTNVGAQIGRVFERQRSEEKLENARNELEKRVEERTRELSRSNEKLKEQDELKTSFVGIAAHEVKTPLTSILGFLQLILQGRLGPITVTQKEALSLSYDVARRLLREIDDLLDMTRIELGQIKMQIRMANIEKILKEEMMTFKTQADEKDIRFEFHADHFLKAIACDEDRIREVFDNLISNSVKYTPRKGRVHFELKNTQNGIQVDVQDTGVGIPKEDQEKIFEPFMTLRKTGLEGEKGSGLGLALVKKIIEAHHGTIKVESEEGRGAKFSLVLPEQQAA